MREMSIQLYIKQGPAIQYAKYQCEELMMQT